jgi:hypothetical protein
MKDFDQLGVQSLGKRVAPLVQDPSWQIDDAVAPLPGEMVLNKASSGGTRVYQGGSDPPKFRN